LADKSEEAATGQAARDQHPHDVFISYSSQNKAVADTVCAVLELNGVRCWMAPRDITPGAEWAGSIIHAINDTRAFVLIFSSFANTSLQVKREVERAANRGIPIIPFRLEDIPANETLEFFISTPHWLDALSPPLESHAEHLSRVVERLLGDTKPKLTRARRRAGSAEAVAEAVEDVEEAKAASEPAPEPEIMMADPVLTRPEPAPEPPAKPAPETVAAATTATARPQTIAGFQPNTAPGEAPVTAAIAQTRPPAHPMEPVWATGIGALLAVLPFLGNISPQAGWSLLTLFILAISVSLFRLGFLKPLKALGFALVMMCGFIAASFIGDSMAKMQGAGGALNAGQVLFAGGVTALSLASGGYATLILFGEKLSNAAALRMGAIYTGVLTVAGAILSGVWAAAHPALRFGPVDILWAAPWLFAYGSGFFAVAAGTINPLISAEGRRNVTEQSAARIHDQVIEPRHQNAVLLSWGVLLALVVLFFTLVAAANVGNSGPSATNSPTPDGPKDPATVQTPEQPPQPPPEPEQPTYDGNPPPEENYDANPPVDQQSNYEGQ
jgi:hypothetical protein